MNNAHQRGGGYLRIYAIKKIYQKLGLNVVELFQDNFTRKITVRSILDSFYYGLRTAIMFRPIHQEIPNGDIYHLDNLRQFSWIKASALKHKFIIYNAHNLEFENYFGRRRGIFANRFTRFEVKQMEKASLIFVCSNREKEIVVKLNKNLENKIFVLPNLVEKNNYYHKTEKNVIAFIGSLSYFPNIQAIEYLCGDFINKIPDHVKDKCKFVIAGRGPLDGQAIKVQQAGFKFFSDLSDEKIRELYASTKILLVPLESGSGTRLKIIEAIFSGAKVISTPLGAEGIESQVITISNISDFHKAFLDCLEERHDNNRVHIDEFSKKYDIEEWFKDNELQLSSRINQF